MIDGKEGLNKKNLVGLIFICALAFVMVFFTQFVIASCYNLWGLDAENVTTLNYTVATGLEVIEDVQQNFSILINTSANRQGQPFNITRIDVFLPNQIVFVNGSNSSGGNISQVSASTHAFVNFTFLNISRTHLVWRNTTAPTVVIPGGNISYNNSILYFNWTCYDPGRYNISMMFYYNGSAPLASHNVTNISIIVKDVTKPDAVNITIFDSIGRVKNNKTQWGRTNHSGTITLNITVADNGNLSGGATPEITGVNITFWNISKVPVVNASSLAATNRSAFSYRGNSWDYTLNTIFKGIADGLYNITIRVNDTYNNINETNITNIIIDNTAPIGTMKCSPSDAFVGTTITCTCSVGDALAGIDTTTYTSSPSTSNAGAGLTQTCVAVDTAGNTKTITSNKYTIWGNPSGTGPSTGAPTVSKTTTISTISPGVPKVITSIDSSTNVKEITIEVSSTANNVKIDVNKYSSKPSGVLVAKSGSYKYIQVNTQNLANKLSKATMKIYVDKSWVSSLNIDKEDVALFKYDEANEKWNELTTSYNSEDSNYYYYSVEVTSFSYFSIAPKEGVEFEEPTGTEEETPDTGKDSTWLWVTIIIIILILIIVSGIGLAKRRRK